jgi:NADH-quinone oxidoreductase subunit M
MVFAPLVVLVLWMGVYPSSFLDIMHVSVNNLIDRVESAQAASAALVAGR